MPKIDDQRDEKACDLSGDTNELYSCFCIHRGAANVDGLKVAKQEWMLGLPRGGLPYYLKSRENRIVLRDDISDIYNYGGFILAPTFKTYMDTMRFMELAGVKNRKGSDKSPRRPLTALASPSGTYRYVFIAYTEAARALQVELKLRPPTKEDMNGGIYPLDNKPCLAGSDQFPVVECCTHPYSISTLADRTFCKRSTLLTAQWHALVGHILYQRVNQALNPPRWFVDAPKCGDDDVELTPSEASGYQLSSGGKYPVPEPGALLSNADVSATDFRIAIADWVCNKKDPKAAPPKEHPILTTYKTRRSERLRAKARPCDRPPTPDRPPPSPTRNVPRALATCRRDLTRSPPAWAGHNGNFPTGRFSSNDWAYFCYNVNLAYTPSMDT